MKKIYVIFSLLLVAGISTGIWYFTEYRESKMNFPKDVSMVNQSGETYSFNNMEPKIRLLEFMYTKCPDVCPSTTFKLQKLRDQLEKENVFGSKVEFLTVTFDPENDTEKVLDHYAKTFEMDKTDGWHLLRGSNEDTKKLADQFNFQYRDPGTGQFVHTNATYLVDAENRVIEVMGMGKENFDQDKIYNKIMSEVD
ncbi:SCO family protein [Bacillus sp. V5-8f]|uniref:SCO family protein n=1 Tax=Bacillus sp. V5-8f TaxID=2053044 RepID=UPI000C773F2D|nr:SCO family protein [Bacillus sp. V5-8f]PLT33817.1 SCO family protein [Bacillus sp. V5-8f]